MFITLIAWLGFAYLVGKYAEKKGRGLWSFFLLSLLLSPIVGFIIAIILGKKEPEKPFIVPDQFVSTPKSMSPLQEQMSHIREQEEVSFCPNCGSKVLSRFTQCPNCGEQLR